MDFEMVSKMKVDELKKYLRLRGLKLSGRKPELVARVFSAYENNVQPIKSATEVETELQQEYQTKLLQNNYIIPDPYHLSVGWLTEDEGIFYWPFISYPEIYNYLMFHPNELGSSDLNDYKNSKGYSYFKRGWLGNISYHCVETASLYCLLKADCRPSERLNDPPHKLWICVTKKDGAIKSGHCSCMAGMSGTCNHVTSMLFRIEAAIRLGLTNPSCTTRSCEWLPNRKAVVAVKAKDLKLSRDDFGKQGKKSRKLVSTPKKMYNPLSDCDYTPLKFADVAAALNNVVPDSLVCHAVPKPKIDFLVEVVKPGAKPENLVSVDDVIVMSGDVDMFYKNLHKMFSESIQQIEICTKGQSDNEVYLQERCHHRIKRTRS